MCQSINGHEFLLAACQQSLAAISAGQELLRALVNSRANQPGLPGREWLGRRGYFWNSGSSRGLIENLRQKLRDHFRLAHGGISQAVFAALVGMR